jgi:hypothetical protein
MARPWRLYRQVYGPAVLALGLSAGGLLAVAFGRIGFDYARSLEHPSLGGMASAPIISRTAAYLEATAVNTLTRLPAAQREPIPTIELAVDPEQLSQLGPRVAKNKSTEVRGNLRMGTRLVPVQVSLRGDNIFQWGAELRSFKVSLPKDEAVLGQRELNLINPKDPAAFSLPYGEFVAGHFGLLVPGTQPCRFLLNGENQGVYFCQQPIDEAWLRQQKRIPGNLYGGDYLVYGYGADVTDAMRLWDMPEVWKQTALVADQGDGRGELKEFFDALRAVVRAPAQADPAPLRERLGRIANVDAFLAQWAVHAWTDSPHQDEFHNWRLYFDPSRGTLEPIVWDTLRNWDARGAAALDSPLPRPHMALLRFPELNQRRYELLYQRLIVPELTAAPSAKWAAEYMARTKGTLLSAVSVDRMDWSPGVLMWLPVSRFKALAEQRREVALITEHAHKLADELAAVRVTGAACAPDGAALACRLTLASRAGLRLVAAVANGRTLPLARLPAGGVPRFAAGTPTGAIDFYPQFTTAPVPRLPGRYQAALAAAPQPFRIAVPGVTALVFENSLTGIRWPVPVAHGGQQAGEAPVAVYSFRPAPPGVAAPLVLGPGTVDVRASVLTAVGQGLRVLPGTTLRMGPDVSLVVRGKLELLGTAEAPVSIVPRESDRRWGGLFAFGDAAAGSRLTHCRLTGGTKAAFAKVTVTGMLQISHTHDVAVTDCDVSDNGVGDDTAHFLQVTELSLARVNVHDGRSDCIDFDYVQARIRDLRAGPCGNDGLDMMTSVVAVDGAVLAGCGDKGASIGERTVVRFANTSFLGDTIGMQAKDLSEAYVEASNRFAGNQLDVSAYRKSKYYGDGGCVMSALAAPLVTSMLDGSRFLRVTDLADLGAAWQTAGKAGPCWSAP